LLDIAKDPKASAAIKVAALAAASKVEPRYLHSPIDLPAFASIQEAEAFKLQLSRQELKNDYDRDSVNRAFSRIDNWINDQRADALAQRLDAELAIKQAQLPPPPGTKTRIEIIGGLDPLPGTNISLHEGHPPGMEIEFNGKSADKVIEHKANELDWSHKDPPTEEAK
jgi:hypothetical protein